MVHISCAKFETIVKIANCLFFVETKQAVVVRLLESLGLSHVDMGGLAAARRFLSLSLTIKMLAHLRT